MRNFFLKTTRLEFSVWSEKDRLDALELWGNPEVTKFIVADGKMLIEQIHQRLKKEYEDCRNRLIIEQICTILESL